MKWTIEKNGFVIRNAIKSEKECIQFIKNNDIKEWHKFCYYKNKGLIRNKKVVSK